MVKTIKQVNRMVTSVRSPICVYREMQRHTEGGGCLSSVSSKEAMEGAMVWMNSDLRSRRPAMGREEKLDPLVYNHLFK